MEQAILTWETSSSAQSWRSPLSSMIIWPAWQLLHDFTTLSARTDPNLIKSWLHSSLLHVSVQIFLLIDEPLMPSQTTEPVGCCKSRLKKRVYFETDSRWIISPVSTSTTHCNRLQTRRSPINFHFADTNILIRSTFFHMAFKSTVDAFDITPSNRYTIGADCNRTSVTFPIGSCFGVTCVIGS